MRGLISDILNVYEVGLGTDNTAKVSEVQAPPPERIPSGQILPSTPINQASASFQVFMLSGCWDQRVCRKWMWLPRGELMEEVNLDEESTGSVLYGAKFDQYCTVSDLT